MNRRTAIALLGAGILPSRLATAQHHAAKIQSGKPYHASFFSPAEHHLIDALTEIILPADAKSPGASAARCADYIDLIAANSNSQTQDRWRAGLAAFDHAAQKEFGQPAAKLSPVQLTALLTDAAREEQAPTTASGRFFVQLKQQTLQAYYTSQIGIQQELGYKGPEVLGQFPGCKA
jgi:hypothetical protein